ncbi:hypothetical protein S40293_09419 [Stachybotrys chartarum IBT 40293]|nr:hypothetical protein S40293_09419 [Stachybotrys chartarum IBT 40293]
MPALEVHHNAQDHLDLDGLVDEDLINYDSDGADAIADETAWPEPEVNADLQAEELLALVSESAPTATEPDDDVDKPGPNEQVEDVFISHEADDTKTMEPSQQQDVADDAGNDDIDFDAGQGFATDHVTSDAGDAAASPRPDMAEIDYDQMEDAQDVRKMGDQHENAQGDTTGPSTPSEDTMLEGDVVSADPLPVDLPLSDSQHGDAAQIPAETEEDEINWNGGAFEETAGSVQMAGSADDSLDDSGALELGDLSRIEDVPGDDFMETTYDQFPEGAVVEEFQKGEEETPKAPDASFEDMDAEHQDDHANTADALDDLSDHEGSIKEERPVFPAITVQYKGDEYSLFSEGPDGFFSELSVFHGNMEALLAAFRAELANEIASDEELVFQVDELGLEFAESHLRDTLSGITLREIVEVFDLLVKNQDPNTSRVLYTYLFAKSSTSKRFESLVESAAAGKGIDEVTRLFGSPLPHGAGDLTRDASVADGDDGQLDSHESPDDEESGSGEVGGASLAEGIVPDDEEIPCEPQDEALDEPGMPVDDQEPALVNEPLHAELPVEDANREVSEGTNRTSDGKRLDDVDYGAVSTPARHSDESEADELDSREQPEQEEAGAEAEIIEYGDYSMLDDEATYGASNDASTTETLADIADTEENSAHLETEALDEADLTEPLPSGQEGEDEIDWRDEVEAVDDAVGDPNATAGATKRPRVDDELGVEDDQDVKRRRS